jgi:DNA-binding NtrC family response regulator
MTSTVGQDAAPQPAERGRVLVVDDDPAVRTSLSALLADDFDVMVVGDVAHAEVLLSSAAIDVVLSDYELPGEKGLTFLQRLGANHPGVMGILVTGRSQDPEVRYAEGQDFVVRVIHKPYEPQRMIRWVESTVKLARMRQAIHRLAVRTHG